MLIKFKTSNFLSFNEMGELSLIAGKVRTKEEHINNDSELKLLKFSAIFGANASGKSNFLKAMSFAQKIITNGMLFNISDKYCKIINSNKEKLSTFDFEIEIDGKYYSYGFDILINKNEIKNEWLYELNLNGTETPIFVRTIKKEEKENKEFEFNTVYFEQKDLERLKVYGSDIKNEDKVLFLNIMNQNKDNLYFENIGNIHIFKKIYTWFAEKLRIIYPQERFIDDSYYGVEDNLSKIADIVSKFGTGIEKCKFSNIENEYLTSKVPQQILSDMLKFTEENYMIQAKNNINKTVKVNTFLRLNNELYILEKIGDNPICAKELKFEHSNSDGEYSFLEESDGTQRILDLIEMLLNRDKEKVYIIDELDRCLHPQLTYKFIQEFLKNTNNNVQLIVTTHESRLLNFDLLRRDEIWFVNREKNGPSTIYSLEEYNERFDKKIDKAYLDGRYGGVPIFEAVFPLGDDIDENS